MRISLLNSPPILVVFHLFSPFWITTIVGHLNHSSWHHAIVLIRFHFGRSNQGHLVSTIFITSYYFDAEDFVSITTVASIAASNLASSCFVAVIRRGISPPVTFELQIACLLSPVQLVLPDLDRPSFIASELVTISVITAIIEAIAAIEDAITITFVVAIRQFIAANAERVTHHGPSFWVLAFLLQALQHHSFTWGEQTWAACFFLIGYIFLWLFQALFPEKLLELPEYYKIWAHKTNLNR